MHINTDFRTRLRESPGSEGGRFELLPAGEYRMSIQPSPRSSLDLSAPRRLRLLESLHLRGRWVGDDAIDSAVDLP